jgi:iron complex transport system substrate-binding protein
VIGELSHYVGFRSDRIRRVVARAAALVISIVGVCDLTGCDAPARPAATEPATPTRIVSLTLASDEVLSELVPVERIVGVTRLADDSGISNVGGYYPKEIARFGAIDPERVIALGPDLVCVAPYNTADSLKLLERTGVAIFRNQYLNSIDEIEAGILRLGERVHEAEKGRAMVSRMRSRRAEFARRLREVASRPRVLFWSAGFTAGRKTTIDDMIREAGGRNVAVELDLEGSAEISPERVIGSDPDVVLLSRWKADEQQSQILAHAILRQLRAVREGHVIVIDGRYLTSISQFAIEGLDKLAHALHPEAFSAEARR